MRIEASRGQVRLSDREYVALAAGQRRLADRTGGAVGATGLVPAPCRGRVLETALALRLLDLEGIAGTGRAALAGFLDGAGQATGADGLDRVMAGCALAGTPLPEAAVGAALNDFDHFTSHRKRTMLSAVAVVFGGPRSGEPAGRLDRTALHAWASAQLTACEVIADGTATAEQRGELLAAQAHDGIWDGHVLCHLLTLHALRLLPGTGAVVARGVDRTLALRRGDGGIPFIERLDIFATAVAGLGLVGSDGPAAGTVRQAADRIAALQRPKGGWGYATGVTQPDVDTTTVCLELLHAVDPLRYAEPIGLGVAYLRELRGTDGGFPTYLRGARSEVAMTAATANALAAHGYGDRETLAETATFIVRRQHTDGTFEPGWSRSVPNAMFRSMLALRRVEPGLGADQRSTVRQAVLRSLAYLRATQNADGGWGHLPGEDSDPISTAFALIGVAQDAAGNPAARGGVAYLLAGQREDGGFDSRPDSTGPRGFVYDVPVLADLYPLLSMGHLTGQRSGTCNSTDR